MNAIHLLSAQPWVERLGLTLLHFLWQGVLIVAVYAAARKWLARVSRPNVRYTLACTALAILVAAPVLTWILLRAPTLDAVAIPHSPPISAATTAAVRNLPATFSVGVSRALPAPFLSWVVAVWLAGALAFWLRLLGGWIFAERLRSRLVCPASREWQQTLDRLKTRIRVSRPVHLLVSSLVQAPTVIGWLRPVVLVPVGALAGLPPEQIEALLLHELAHVRRHDYLVNVLQSLVEALLFYHPAVWWISGHIRAERELCCDDVAVSVTGDALTYVRALAELESARPAHFRVVLAANGGSLAHRVGRLLGQSRPAPRTFAGPGIAGSALVAITALALFGQPGVRPKFEVASIKPTVDQGFKTVRPLPGRLTADAPLRLLLQNAYSLQSFQIVGGPDWIDSNRYSIDAKAAGDPGRDQIFLMLQSLLEDRFHLKIHHETRDLPVYALAAAKSGLKLSPPKENGCMDPAPGALPPWAGGRMQPPAQGQTPAAPCGRVGIMLEPGGALMQGGKVPMAELVRALSMVLGRPVIDKSGFAGLFDVRLSFLPDETTAALPAPPPDPAGSALDSKSPAIFAALQEQLGLRLESTKGPVDVIVIDHVEQPTAN